MIGVRISKEGETVTDGDVNQYVDTETPLFKLYITNSDSRTYTAATGSPFIDTITIHHGLGYIPMFLIFMDRNSNSVRKIVNNEDGSFPQVTTQIFCICSADNQNIYVTVAKAVASVTGTFGFNYFIFYDKVG